MLVVDLIRAVLIVLMSSSHALTLAGIDPGHFLYSDFWLPNGWATVTFIFLSGFAASSLSLNRKSMGPLNFRSRACDLICVMLVSNFVFNAIRYFLYGNSIWASTVSAISDSFSAEKWTISAILLPTAIILYFAAGVINRIKKDCLNFFAIVLACRMGVELMVQYSKGSESNLWFDFLFVSGLGGFPVIPLCLNGLLGLALGVAYVSDFAVFKRMLGYGIISQLVLFVLISKHGLQFTGVGGDVAYGGLGVLGFFSWIFLLSSFAIRFDGGRLLAVLLLIGKYALMAFIFHRIIMQGIKFSFDRVGLDFLGREAVYSILLTFSLMGVWLLCLARDRSDYVNSVFKRIRL